MNPYLLPAIEVGPKVLSRMLGLIPESRHDERPDPDRFSPREVIAHLADWELLLLERMRGAFLQPGIGVQAIDEGQRAIDQDYASTDVWQQLSLFIERRRVTAEFLRGLSAEDWEKQFVHNERGPLSIEDQANMLLGHDLYHIEQLSDLVSKTPAG